MPNLNIKSRYNSLLQITIVAINKITHLEICKKALSKALAMYLLTQETVNCEFHFLKHTLAIATAR